jgi:hypothetical protein
VILFESPFSIENCSSALQMTWTKLKFCPQNTSRIGFGGAILVETFTDQIELFQVSKFGTASMKASIKLDSHTEDLRVYQGDWKASFKSDRSGIEN